MRGKGLLIAAGIVFVMALVCLFGGDFKAFGGALIVAAVLFLIWLILGRRPKGGDIGTNELKTIEGKRGRVTVANKTSRFLFIPVKNTEILSIESDACPLGRTFGEWHEKVHQGAAQSDRFERAGHECIALLKFDPDTGVATINGSGGKEYTTTLDYCSCPDFEKRSKPCKHIYFLATKMGYTSSDFYG